MIRVQRVFRLNGTCFLNYVRTRNEPSLINVLIMKKLTHQALEVPNLTTQFNSHEFEWQCFQPENSRNFSRCWILAWDDSPLALSVGEIQ